MLGNESDFPLQGVYARSERGPETLWLARRSRSAGPYVAPENRLDPRPSASPPINWLCQHTCHGFPPDIRSRTAPSQNILARLRLRLASSQSVFARSGRRRERRWEPFALPASTPDP